MTKVNTLIIGAGRSGTTSVYAYLSAHPEVNFSITKELHYFSIPALFLRGENYFHSMFSPAQKKITATADTYLLMDSNAPEKVKQYNPEMKIIIMLREPVARSYSNFNYSLNFGHEKKGQTFVQTIPLEQDRLQSGDIVTINNTCHCYGSLYYKHISQWNKYFDNKQLLIYTLDALKNNPDSFYQNLCRQLQINYVPFKEAANEFNAASGAKSIWLQQLLLNRNHPMRKIISFMLRPVRNWVIKSGMIDKVYAVNKKKVAVPPLSQEDMLIAKKYFEEDLSMLKATYHISFEN